MKTQKTKIGVVGCGRIAAAKHFPAFKKASSKVELVAFCDIVEERAQDAASKYGTSESRIYTDYKQMLQETDAEVIYVLTPNNAHCGITVDSLRSKKHVLCEKPMAATSEEAKLMLDTAKETGMKLTIGYQNRFRKDVQTLKTACDADELGEVYFAKSHAVRRKAVPTWGVFLDKEKQGGGPLIDIGTHALDLTLWTMDNYKPVQVNGSVFHKMKDNYEGNLFGPWDPETIDVEDSAFGFIKMENGATIFLEASWALNIQKPREGQITLCGTKAGAELVGEGAAAPTSAVNGTGAVTFNTAKLGQLVDIDPIVISGPGPMDMGDEPWRVADAELAAWLDAIENDKDPVVTPEQAYIVTQVLEAIYESARTGKPVDLA